MSIRDIYPTEKSRKKTAPKKSVAVLPFVNMSNDPEQEYFSDGIAEEIINSLSYLQELKVAGRISSFQFKGSNADIREIGEKLGVSTVIEGSIRKHGNTLRVTAQLVNVRDGFHLWSEKYDRNLDDIFAIQDEIALAITEKLKVTLLDNDRETTARSRTKNQEAYDLYLKGQFHINRRGASLISGMQFLQEAIKVDPDFALAHAAYADANFLMASYGIVPPKMVMEKGRQAAEQAIKLNPLLCEPYCSLGYYYTCFEWNWAEAKKNFLQSIELNPRFAEAHYRYGWNYLTWIEGNFDEAVKHGKISIELEPLSSICYGAHSLILHTACKFNEALDIAKAGLELDANSFLCGLVEGNAYLDLKQYDDAIIAYEKAMKISNRHHFPVNGLIMTYSMKGDSVRAEELMRELKDRSAKEYIAGTFTAISAAYLGDLETGFEFLEKAYNDRDPIILTLKYEHWAPDVLRQDPRFAQLLERIGFP